VDRGRDCCWRGVGVRALTSGRAWVLYDHRYPTRDQWTGPHELSSPTAMPRTRALRARETKGGWADLPGELMAMVLELLEAAGQQGGLGFTQASATVRLVCAAWKAVHDALVKRLMLRRQTTDEAMGMLVRSFPAVVSLETTSYWRGSVLTDSGLRAVSSCTSLTSLNLTNCRNVTDEGMRAVIK
jgi:hypothetical protein